MASLVTPSFRFGEVNSVDRIENPFGLNDWALIWLEFGPIVCGCLIATLIGSRTLKRELSVMTWAATWTATGVVSCVGSIIVPCLIVASWEIIERPTYSLSDPLDFALAAATLGRLLFVTFAYSAALKSVVVALLLAPVSLAGRWLVLRRTRGDETAGGVCITQP